MGNAGNSPNSWIDEGIRLRSEGKYEESIHAFDMALELDPDDSHIWLNKAHTYRLMNNYEKKLDCNRKAMDLEPKDPRTKKLYAEALLLLNRLDDALEVLLEALTLDTKRADIWYYIGQVYRSQQKHELATVMYAKSLDLDPTFYRSWAGKGYAYIGQKKLEEALRCFENAFEYCSENCDISTTILSGFAYTYYYLGMYDQSLEYVDIILGDVTDMPAMWKLRSDIMKAKSRFEEAIISVDQALLFQPNNPSYHMQKCLILLEFEQLEYFEQFHSKMHEKFPDNPETHAVKGKYHHLKENLEKAKTSYLKALDLDDSFVYAMDGMASITTSQGDFETTIAYFDKILAQDPSYPTTIYQKGKLMIALKQYDQAIECFNKLIRMGKNEFDSYISLGYIYLQQEDWKNSLKYYHRALDMDPYHKQILFLIGLVHYYWYEDDETHKIHQAINYFKRAIDLDPDYKKALAARGSILEEMGRSESDLIE